MRKWMLLLTAAMLVSLLFGCGTVSQPDEANATGTGSQQAQAGAGGNQIQSSKYADGMYFAEEVDFPEGSNWRSVVTLTVENGKIVKVDWNAVSKNAGLDKKAASIKGDYGMVAKGKAQAEWHEQAAIMEKLLIEKQDPNVIAVNSDGKTDAVSGVSITVNDFKGLAIKALAAGPVKPGPYKDGAYNAEGAFDEKSGWKETVDVTVVFGKIAAVNWNGVNKEGQTKKKFSQDGLYGMKEKGKAQAEWHEQAVKAEQHLLKAQDPKAIKLKDDGKTDAISGVSINVDGFLKLVDKALEGAKR